MVLFQVTDIDINRAWEISPYNGTAFGALIVFLLVAIGAISWYFLKQIEKKDEIIKEKDQYIKDTHDKTHEIADVMTEKLTELRHSNENTKEKMLHFFEIIKEKLNSIS